jgi:hypothetical protein
MLPESRSYSEGSLVGTRHHDVEALHLGSIIASHSCESPLAACSYGVCDSKVHCRHTMRFLYKDRTTVLMNRVICNQWITLFPRSRSRACLSYHYRSRLSKPPYYRDLIRYTFGVHPHRSCPDISFCVTITLAHVGLGSHKHDKGATGWCYQPSGRIFHLEWRT